MSAPRHVAQAAHAGYGAVTDEKILRPLGMTMSGTYVVNPGKLSGSASMTVVSVANSACGNNGDGDTLTMDFYLSNGLKTLSYVETDPDDEGYLPYDFDDGVLAGPATHF